MKSQILNYYSYQYYWFMSISCLSICLAICSFMYPSTMTLNSAWTFSYNVPLFATIIISLDTPPLMGYLPQPPKQAKSAIVLAHPQFLLYLNLNSLIDSLYHNFGHPSLGISVDRVVTNLSLFVLWEYSQLHLLPLWSLPQTKQDIKKNSITH